MGFIRFSGVDFHYGPAGSSAVSILKGLELELAQGEFYVLLGPSGCGKTTALNLLAGFERPSAGTIVMEGHAIGEPGMDRVVIFQGDDSLYPWLTAQENVEFPLRMTGVGAAERRRRAATWLSRVGLANHGQKFPHQLSGGMKQRIQIARALVCDAPVLLMDEPFGALDAQTRTILQDELVSICNGSGATVLFITHDIAEAIILADRIGVMRAGPGSAVKDEFALDLPRPRNRGSVEFAAAYDRIQRVLGEEVRKVVTREAAA
ncbi:ABC transporter ATP-binding protein [Sabulicella glaciei]|uniref:ABC transporter ATP-binding protein n=1 Tax=Sabulicella glaciei TaxID=2984948 RepID=A0ABT3NZ18_9PROT|nr:ABC transporter ATP-binding protein [Roseococcus sp. MDT2-1-1]MCW8087391.1 ABC transporter ATP-binding protein [Roseococcus sp. MDT2-1-1]